MPIAIEARMDVIMKDGVTLREINCWALGGSGLNAVDIKAGIERPEGRVQRVRAKIASNARCTAMRLIANSLDRNLSSPKNLQLTVHLNKNCRVNSNDRARYPFAFAGRNGKASVTCCKTSDRLTLQNAMTKVLPVSVP